MKALKKTGCVAILCLASAFLLNSLAPLSCLAVLPPGANESLAAKAPIVLIGKVLKLADASSRKLVAFRILETGRGQIQPGTDLEVELARPPKKKLMGPTVVYHKMAPGQTWLLFLLSPQGKILPYHTLAAHGWYTRKLDGIPDAEALVGLLPQAGNPKMAESLNMLREIYQGAGQWWEKNKN